MSTEFTTPMMLQYRRLKRQYADCLLMFRLGDFYELFEEDARKASEVLHITLTSREASKGKRIPMCGVPFHSASRYIQRLLDAGYKVAICEQVEDPKKAKGLVRREVVEVLTPGAITREEFLKDDRKNFLASAFFTRTKAGFALAEITTGDFLATEWSTDSSPKNGVEYIKEELRLRNPREILCAAEDITPDALDLSSFPVKAEWVEPVSSEEAESLFASSGSGFLAVEPEMRRYPVALRAAGLIVQYLKQHRLEAISHLFYLRPYRTKGRMSLDFSTVRNLEILSSREGEMGSLFAVLNHTKTPMGKRLLRDELLSPFTELDPIHQRLDAVEELFQNGFLRDNLREALSGILDVERMVSRIVAKKGKAYDLFRIREFSEKISTVRSLLDSTSSPLLRGIHLQLSPDESTEKLFHSLKDALSEEYSEERVFRKGYDAQLDEWQKWMEEGSEWLKRFEERERTRTGFKTLKVRYNEVFGYFLEITKAQLGQMQQLPPEYERKQTLVSVERFTTPELKEVEAKILSASELWQERQKALVEEFLQKVEECASVLFRMAKALGHLDLLQSLAEAAENYGYVRPVVEEGDLIEIRRGRHPVVEHTAGTGNFVPNDLRLTSQKPRLIILTGPNMAGKSTFIRQAGLIVLMAQMGSFVPADYARIGLVDSIFVRAGASDDITRGVSTFFMEMAETARILQLATPQSLIILDEVGRGTSTYDGMSIAWAIAEYLATRLKCRTLFATHFHELTALENLLPGVENYQMLAREEGGKAIFLHKVGKGKAEKSYGIYVAALAGIPPLLVRRASEILSVLEQKSALFSRLSPSSLSSQPPLFDEFPPEP
ncbi:MAG: DNA mismatch repair protein MutS [bacterium JZ-2024 1]